MKGKSTFFLGLFLIPLVVGFIDLTPWQNVLSTHITPGVEMSGIVLNQVDYNGIANDSDFTLFLDTLANADVSGYTYSEFYAFYINAYNALAVKTIVENPCDHDPFGNCGGCISGIEDVGDWIIHPVWNLNAGTVANQTVTLDDVENLLRSPANWTLGPSNVTSTWTEDSRLHASIVCASISCPNLQPWAYQPDNISAQLDLVMKEFLNNTGKGMNLNQKDGSVELSSIFNWFAPDFEAFVNGTVLDFVALYSNNSQVQSYLNSNPNVSVSYFDYDWNLNGELACSGCSNRICFPIWAMLVAAGVLLVVFALVFTIACCCYCRRRKKHKEYIPVEDVVESHHVNEHRQY